MATNEGWKSRRGAGRVAFLAELPDIKAKYQAGWTVRMIYEELSTQKTLPLGYAMFVKYMRRYVSGEPQKQGVSDHLAKAPVFLPSPPQSAVASGSANPLPPRRQRLPGEPVVYDPRPSEELLGLAPKNVSAPTPYSSASGPSTGSGRRSLFPHDPRSADHLTKRVVPEPDKPSSEDGR